MAIESANWLPDGSFEAVGNVQKEEEGVEMLDLRKGRDRLRSPLAIAAVAVFALAGGLAACGSDDDNSGDTSGGGDTAGKKVYLNAYAQEIAYFRDWEAGATARGEELGW